MTSEFKTGIKIGLIIYGLGTIITIVVHLFFGWDYPHGPPTSALPLFLTLAVGAFRLLMTSLKTMAEKSQRAKGELFVHLGIALIIFAFIGWVKSRY